MNRLKEWKKMKKKTIIIIIFMMLILFSSSSISISISANSIDNKSISIQELDHNSPEDIEYYALIIGVETFVGGILYPMEDKLDDDAIAMYNLLLNSSNWKEQNIRLILNENATKDKIRDKITGWLGNVADENDVVLIYYISHGWKTKLKDRLKGNAYIFTYNHTKGSGLETKITDKEFDSYVDNIKSKHIAIIFGSCYSGRMLALRQRGRVILAPGGRFLFCGVDECDVLKSGIFGYFLRKGFEGVADLNNDGWVTAEEAFIYAKIPAIWHSFWVQFPFIQNYYDGVENRTIFFLFQIPVMFDRYFGQLKLFQYEIKNENQIKMKNKD